MTDTEYVPLTEWDEFVGQDALKLRLDLLIESARAREVRALEPIMLFGPPGCGKSTLAGLISRRMDYEMTTTMPPLDSNHIRFVVSEDSGPLVLFVDEIHRAKQSEQEMLYPMLQDGYFETGGYRYPTDHVTIIAATTEGDKLERAMLDRFLIKPAFVDYSEDEMVCIANQMMYKLGLPWDMDLAKEIAGAATGSPRRLWPPIIALRDLHATDREYNVDIILDMCNITKDGLTDHHVNYLKYLDAQRGQPQGMDALKIHLDLGAGMVKDLERIFMDRRWIERTSRGRRLTPSGFKRVKKLKETTKAKGV